MVVSICTNTNTNTKGVCIQEGQDNLQAPEQQADRKFLVAEEIQKSTRGEEGALVGWDFLGRFRGDLRKPKSALNTETTPVFPNCGARKHNSPKTTKRSSCGEAS